MTVAVRAISAGAGAGVNRLDLARANNATISGSTITPSLKAGQMIHVPFVGVTL